MEQPKITFVVNDQTYSLSANDTQAIQSMPSEDRGQLIALLEAVKRQEALAAETVQQALERAKAASQTTPGQPLTGTPAQAPTPKPERLGSGDADALMARLIMEEQQNRKPGLTRQSLYKFVIGSAAVVVVLVLIS